MGRRTGTTRAATDGFLFLAVVVALAALAPGASGCGGSAAMPEVVDAAAEAAADPGTDAAAEAIPETADAVDLPPEMVADTADLPPEAMVDAADPGDLPPMPDVPADTETAGDDGGEPAPDATPDVPRELPPLPLHAPIAAPADPLAGTGVESCPVYLEQRCAGGIAGTCAVYDPAAKAFVDAPDPLQRRVFLFERWRDLYNSPDGLTSERNFNAATPPGTPEADWASPARFAAQDGVGDSGIWSGWTAAAAVLRYSQTGTEADYARMEAKIRTLVTMFDVTGVPGYLCRHIYLLVPHGTPNSPDHIFRYDDQRAPNPQDRDIDPAALAELPAVYRDGVTGGDGTVYKGRPMWHGNPSIDQYTGPMTAFPLAWELIRDPDLKAAMAHHLTCYLKRLQRIELIHLQQNPDLLKALTSYFSAGTLNLSPGDPDPTKLDRVVGYVHRQINVSNEADFDRTCPDTVQMQPWRVIDATGDTFMLDLLNLVQDMADNSSTPNQIDHYYFPNLRGGDAVHMMHLAAMAYRFTGDERYRSFLFDELIGNLQADRVAMTTGAFTLPKWCKSFFGDQITYGPWWAFLEMLGDGDLKTLLQRGFHRELWQKLVGGLGNVDFDVMYAGAVPATIATDRDQALGYVADQLPTFGGNGFVDGTPLPDDPRRNYLLAPETVMARTPDGIQPTCPTQQEFEICTAKIDFMGITLAGTGGFDLVTCSDTDPWQCKLPDGTCTDKMVSGPLPVNLRQYTDYLWQRNPFRIRQAVGLDGGVQYPGTDVSVPYWNARRYGFVTAGAGQVLAWRPGGACR